MTNEEKKLRSALKDFIGSSYKAFDIPEIREFAEKNRIPDCSGKFSKTNEIMDLVETTCVEDFLKEEHEVNAPQCIYENEDYVDKLVEVEKENVDHLAFELSEGKSEEEKMLIFSFLIEMKRGQIYYETTMREYEEFQSTISKYEEELLRLENINRYEENFEILKKWKEEKEIA